jgi:hypothetical protein
MFCTARRRTSNNLHVQLDLARITSGRLGTAVSLLQANIAGTFLQPVDKLGQIFSRSLLLQVRWGG